MKKNPHNGTTKVPSLFQICVKTIASKLERYPPEAFTSISETDWETIIKCRHQATAPKNKKFSHSNMGIDGSGRLSPAISDKTIMEIEDLNPRLASSTLVDILIWKDCVEYKFKRGGPARPKALLYPYNTLVSKLNHSMKVLTSLTDPKPFLFSDRSSKNNGKEESLRNDIKGGSIDATEAHKVIQESLIALKEAPMSVDLLNDTKIGKSLSKLIKKLSKLSLNTDYSNSLHYKIWDRTYSLQSNDAKRLKSSCGANGAIAKTPEENLKSILQSWKHAAFTEGVKITSTSTETSKDSSTSDTQQFSQDMKVLKMCNSWRDLFEALTERKDHMIESHGAKMREKRQNIEKTKNTVKKVTLKTNRFRSKAAISVLGNGSGIPSNSKSTTTSSKLGAWKRDQVLNKARQKGLKTAKLGAPKVSAFSQAVANATKTIKKRKAIGNRRKEIVLDGGSKRMRMPTRDRDNKFASNQLRNKLKRGFRR